MAKALATAPGNPHTFHPEAHHQDHVRAGDRLGHHENIGELLIGHPAMGADDKVADIRQDRRESSKLIDETKARCVVSAIGAEGSVIGLSQLPRQRW